MSATDIMQFDQAPQLLSVYKRALFGRRPGLRAALPLPELQAAWRGIRVDMQNLSGYRTVCGYGQEGPLPLLYPYVLTARLQMALMSAPQFPLRVLGLVHHRNRIVQHKAIPADAVLDSECRVGAARPVKQGIEFDMHAAVAIAGETVWENTSTYLARGKTPMSEGLFEPPRLSDLPEAVESADWAVPADMGRRYARVSGDYNPIHVSSILAKLFGFPRAIVHGMWTAASCLAHLPAPDGAVECLIAFKGPVFPGSRLSMRYTGDAEIRFDAFCGKNPRPSLCGLLRRLD